MRVSRFLAHTGLTLLGLLLAVPAFAQLPVGFTDSAVITGLTEPTVVRFASDGRVFVAEKSGIVKVFQTLTAATPTVFVDLSNEVHNYADRGLLGLALDPNWSTQPYVYVLYAYNKTPDPPAVQLTNSSGAAVPLWNGCPDPPGGSTSGCIITARLSRLTISPANTLVGSEQVLIEGKWCYQFSSHSIGTLQFGPDGMLYVGSGEGASFDNPDWGQYGGTGGVPPNPCGDPDAGLGGAEAPPTAEGGALRAQSVRSAIRTTSVLNGAILRVDPATGAAPPDNPFYGQTGAQDPRIIAFGLRNPFRFSLRPGTSEIWVGDVGWYTWEEIDRIMNPTDNTVENFGWPCWEGPIQTPFYSTANLNLCTTLYATPTTGSAPGPVLTYTAPHFTYDHTHQVIPGGACPAAPQGSGSAVIGGVFYQGGSYPAAYQGAYIFGDFGLKCIFTMFPDATGVPTPSKLIEFDANANFPVNFEIGPGGDVFWIAFTEGAVHRIQYNAPTAVIKANPTIGAAPLTVNFDGSGSTTQVAGGLSYAWDLSGLGTFTDATTPTASYTYPAGPHVARLRVTDSQGASAITQVTIQAGSPPVASIILPSPTLTWKVGDPMTFSGQATDAIDGMVAPSGLTWNIILHHCPVSISNCHTHPVQTFSGVASGMFPAPDHGYPSYLEIDLTATDSIGLTNQVALFLYPAIVNLTLASSPPGVQLVASVVPPQAAPFTAQVIIGSNNALSAPTPQVLGPVAEAFSFWSDSGAQSHNIIAPAVDSTYTATYTPTNQCPGMAATTITSLSQTSGTVRSVVGITGTGLGPNVQVWFGNVQAVLSMPGPTPVAQVPKLPAGVVAVHAVNPEGCSSLENVTFTVTSASCGLLGIEGLAVLVPLAVVRRIRRREHEGRSH